MRLQLGSMLTYSVGQSVQHIEMEEAAVTILLPVPSCTSQTKNKGFEIM